MSNEKAKITNRFAKWSITFVILFITWIILSEIFEAKFITYAVLSCAVIATISLRTLHITSEKSGKTYFLFSQNIFRFIGYFFWLLWQIVLAAIDISKVTLLHREDIQPCVVWFKVDYDNPLALTMLANSITLTPGTITIDIRDGLFSVHALTKSCADGVLDGSMQAKVAWLYNDSTAFKALDIRTEEGRHNEQ